MTDNSAMHKVKCRSTVNGYRCGKVGCISVEVERHYAIKRINICVVNTECAVDI